MKRKIHSRPNRGATDEWLTPPAILEALGPFDLDPASSISRPWPTAAQHFTKEDNGLARDWFGRVWLNPPYGPEAGRWLKKLADHGNGIALVVPRTETAWFYETAWQRAAALLFIRGRLHFHHLDGTRAKGNAGTPSVLVAYGERNAETLKGCDIPGALCLGVKEGGRA